MAIVSSALHHASLSVCIPPPFNSLLCLSTVTAGRDFFISPTELHNVNHTKSIHYIHHVCFHTKRSLLPATSPSVQSCGDKRGTAENHLEPEGMGQCRSLRYRRQQCAYSQFVPLLSAEALAADQ